MKQANAETIDRLVQQSMLHNAQLQARKYSGQGRLWQHSYAETQARAATECASVWFTAYPAAIITRQGESVLQTLGDAQLWQALQEIGIQGIHTGPMKLAGGLSDADYQQITPTIDGNFDRISFEIDPAFGTQQEFIAMSQRAAHYGAVIIDDIIPAHTGKGADFRLAELNYHEYPGLYHMVEIAPDDWHLLPAVAEGEDSVNLLPEAVDQLAAKGYIVGQLQRTIFYEPGVKETDWSATGIVLGADRVARRWLYLHYFKAGQPALNWLDPSFASQQMIIGDALHSLDVMGACILRLDANGFLGVERRLDGPAWSEGHPLSIVGNQLIAGMVRKAGGFSFQELNLAVDDIASMSHGGADLSYDFITRPAYQHALLTGDTEFLRLMLHIMGDFQIDPGSLIHALQNHDELTLELVHFWTLHKDDLFEFQGRSWRGSELREAIRSTMYSRLSSKQTPYNLRFVTNGVACTTTSVIAAALGIHDPAQLSPEEILQIQRIHLLLAMYNAYQPGVFALSGWDLVGALTLDQAEVADLLADGDTRWINRGAYDLINLNPQARMSAAGLPKARTLYGPISEQLKRPDSFASQLKKLLAVRKQYRIYAARQIAVPAVTNKGLLVLIHELPQQMGIQVTALNFGAHEIKENLSLANLTSGKVRNMLDEHQPEQPVVDGRLKIDLKAYEGKSLLIQGELS